MHRVKIYFVMIKPTNYAPTKTNLSYFFERIAHNFHFVV
jgi:hypothetical protein